MSERAQTSLEFVIIVGIFLVMIVSIYPFILRENELNKAVAAARDGASYAVGMRGMGFGHDGANLPNYTGVIKIVNLTLEDLGTDPSGRKCYRIRFYLSVPEYMKESSCSSSSVGMSVRRQAVRFIYRAFYGNWTPPDDLRVCTERFNFTTACSFV